MSLSESVVEFMNFNRKYHLSNNTQFIPLQNYIP